MADDLLSAFVELPSSQRLKSLSKVIDGLSSDERTAVIYLIQEKSDIFNRFPIELIIHIFSYLDVYDAWRLQIVNKRWRQTLSSERFIKATLAKWNTHDRADNGRPQESLAEDSTDERIRHMRAMGSGRPVSQLALDVTRPHGGQYVHSRPWLDLQGHHLAWISAQPRESDAVIVHDLLTGDRRVYRDEAKEKIMTVVLTSKTVSFVTYSGLLYVADLRLPDSEAWSVRLPSACVHTLAGHEDVVVIAMSGSGPQLTVDSLLVYNAKERRLRSIRTGVDHALIDVELIVNAHSQTIDIFALAWHPPPDTVLDSRALKLTHVRLNFYGATLQSSDNLYKVGVGSTIQSGAPRMPPPQPSGYRNEYRVAVTWMRNISSQMRLVFDLYFNTRTCTLTPAIPGSRRHCLIASYTHVPCRQQRFDEFLHAEWKDLQFTFNDLNVWCHNEYTTLVNETFLVSVMRSGGGTGCARLKVFCFDDKVEMEGGVPYKYFPATMAWEEAHAEELEQGRKGFAEAYWINEGARLRLRHAPSGS